VLLCEQLAASQIRFDSQLFLDLQQLAELIDVANEVGCDYILHRVLDAQDTIVRMVNTANGCFIAAVVVCYVIVYVPLIRKMDATIKRSRAMLLLFPSEVVHSVSGIRDVMTAYTKSLAP
jgi:hypothetical protein